MTLFEIAQEKVKNKELTTPSVSIDSKPIDYFGYQLATHKFNLSLMANGLKFRGVKFTDIKNYYGLKGKSAKDCLPELEKIIVDYKSNLLRLVK